MILEDWAHYLSFDPKEIDKERGVIVEEWRLGRGADARMQDTQFPVLLKGSRYAERLPIGKKEVIESFKHDALQEVLCRLVSPRSHGGYRGGRFRQIRRREPHQGTFRLTPSRLGAQAATDL